MEKGTIERAFQLAPECKSIEEIKAKLRREGYEGIDAHLQGPTLRADLKTRLKSD